MTRGIARLVARTLVGVLLLSQLAIAAYACPALSTRLAQAPLPGASLHIAHDQIANADADTADGLALHEAPCDDMVGATDAASSNLCAEHCKYGQQSDHASTLSMPAVSLLALYRLAPWAPEPACAPRPAAASLSALVAASPPHAILHCVSRT